MYTSDEHKAAFLKAIKDYGVEGDPYRLAALYCLTSTDGLRRNLKGTFICNEYGDRYPNKDVLNSGWPSSSERWMIKLACNLFNYDMVAVTPGELAEWLSNAMFAVYMEAMLIRRGALITEE